MRDGVIGAILSGGRAKRMGGRRKGLVGRGSGDTIIRRLIGEMTAAGLGEVIILANEREPYAEFGVEIVADLHPGLGPLAGVEAALEYASGRDGVDAVLFVPCDVPNISRRELDRLLDAHEDEPSGVKTAVVEGEETRAHPTCCVVSESVLPAVKAAISDGLLRIGRMWRQLDATKIFFTDPGPFFNMNTPDDARAWRQKETAMPIRMLVPETLLDKVKTFAEEVDLDVEIVDAEPCDITIAICDERCESAADTLQSGGWITCATALGIAGKHGLSTSKLGALCDVLDIKIRVCSLGCFE